MSKLAIAAANVNRVAARVLPGNILADPEEPPWRR